MKYILNSFRKKEKIRIAGIVADLTSDGHLQGPPKNRIDYTSKSKKELRRFEKEIFNVFGITGKIRECKTNKFSKTYNYGVNNKEVAQFLNSIGVPDGNKVFKNFNVPDWIINDRQMFARFLNRLFSCEGCVDTKYPAIDLKMYKSIELIDGGFDFFKK